MAQGDFNPSPGPPNDPNYIGYSKPTPAPEANRGLGIALDTVAGGTTGSLKFLDEAMKQGLQDKINARVDPERDKMTSALETLNQQLKGQNTAATAAAGSKIAGATDGIGGFGPTNPKSLLDANASADAPEDNLPTGLQEGLDRFTNLTLAKQSGATKLNDTDYAGQVLNIAKQLRNQYPGYREYIDEQTSKASGLPVANSYYQNLLLDVNRQLASQKANKDDFGKQLEWALHEGVPHAGTYMTMRQNNDPKYPGDAAILGRISDWTTYKANLAIQEKQRTGADWDQKQEVQAATKNITNNATNFVKNQVSDNIALSGMPAFKEIAGYFDDVAGNRIKTNETELETRKNQLEVYYTYVQNKLRSDNVANAATIGIEKAEQVYKAALGPIQNYRDLANQKDGPLAQLSMVMSQHIMHDDEYSWLTDKDLGAVGRSFITGRKVFGEQYGPVWLKGALGLGLDDSLTNRLLQEKTAATVPITDANGNPTMPPRYMIDAVKSAKTAGADGKGVPDANYYGHVMGFITSITDPAMPQNQKDALIQWAFNPKNSGIMNELKQDYKRPDTGEWIPGKEAGFTRMTSPAMSQVIAESAKAKPENYDNYLKWTRTEYANAYREDFQQLSQVNLSSNKLANFPGYHLGWNNSSKDIVLLSNKNTPVTRETEEHVMGMSAIFDKVDTVNRGVHGLQSAYMYAPGKPEGADVDGYILSVIKPFINEKTSKSFIADMGRAITKTNKPELSMKDIDNMLFGPAP